MALVDELARLTGAGTAEYTVAGVSYWGTAQFGTILDENRIYWQGVALDFLPRTWGGGSIEYKRAKIPGMAGWFEPGTATAQGTIQDSLGGTVSGTINFRKDGWIDFAADQAGSVRYFTGYTYDVFAAAADVMEAWAAAMADEYDFTASGDSFTRSQKYEQIQAKAKEFRSMAVVRPIEAERSDTVPMVVGAGVKSTKIPEGL